MKDISNSVEDSVWASVRDSVEDSVEDSVYASLNSFKVKYYDEAGHKFKVKLIEEN